ncbi:SRPBCC family protein [soil metagenome]
MATDTFTVERSTHVDAPPQRVYDQIVDFHNWTRWSPWEEMDPDMQRTYDGADSGAGAVYRWSGNRKVGRGAMEITRVVEPSTVEIDLHFERPFKARNDTVFSVGPDGSGARVTWSMTGEKTLMTRVMGVFKSMDQMIGPDFEKGLARLKVVSEEAPTR